MYACMDGRWFGLVGRYWAWLGYQCLNGLGWRGVQIIFLRPCAIATIHLLPTLSGLQATIDLSPQSWSRFKVADWSQRKGNGHEQYRSQSTKCICTEVRFAWTRRFSMSILHQRISRPKN